MCLSTLNQQIIVAEVSPEEFKKNLEDFRYSLFVSFEWTNAFSSAYEVVFFHFNAGAQTVGKLSGIKDRSSKSGVFLKCHSGIATLKGHGHLYNSCLVALYQYGKRNRYGRMFLQAHDQQYPYPAEARGFQNRGYVEFVRYLDDRRMVPEFSRSVSYNVRKAEKVGATFHAEQSERILNRLHQLLEETKMVRYTKHGRKFKSYPYNFLNREILNNLFRARILKLYHIEVDGVVHCVRCVLDQDQRVFGLMIASDAFAYQYGLQHFIHYHLIMKLQKEGYTYYNLSVGDYTNKGSGLSDFKRSLGCVAQKRYGAYTYYLSFPWNLLNPLMKTARTFYQKTAIQKLLTRFDSSKYNLPDFIKRQFNFFALTLNIWPEKNRMRY